MEWMLCIGAGKEQISSIKKAQELNFKVVALDQNPSAEGRGIADIFYCMDINNYDQVLLIAKKYKIVGIVPVPIGRALRTIGYINDQLGLKGISLEGAMNCTDKALFNRILSDDPKFKGFVAQQRLCRNREEIMSAIEEWGLPIIIKPRNGAGSVGCIVIEDEMDIEEKLEEHYHAVKDDTLVEKLMDGKEYGVDGCIYNGKCMTSLVREKIMTDLPYRQEIGYFAPGDISKNKRQEIKEVLCAILEKLNLNNCIFHADILIEKEKIHVIELSGRPAGLKVTDLIFPTCTHQDILGLGIRIVTGKLIHHNQEPMQEKNNKYLFSFINPPKGEVLEIPSDKLLCGENIIAYDTKIRKGDIINRIRSGRDVYPRGFIFCRGKNRQECDEIISSYIKEFRIK